MFLELPDIDINQSLGPFLDRYEIRLISSAHMRVNKPLAAECRAIFKNAYYNTTWHLKLDREIAGELNDPNLAFMVFEHGKVIAGRTMVCINEKDMCYEKMLDLAQHVQPKKAVRGHSAFTIPDKEGQGIMSALIPFMHAYMHNTYGVDYVLGISSHVCAYRLYEKQGAQFHKPDIQNLSNFIPPEESERFFWKFLRDPEMKGWKIDNAIRYFYRLT